jgi:hypothetical protein
MPIEVSLASSGDGCNGIAADHRNGHARQIISLCGCADEIVEC